MREINSACKSATTEPTVTVIHHALITLREVVEKALTDLTSDQDGPASGQAAPRTYFDFKAGLLIRHDVDPADLSDDLCIRLLENLLREGRHLSSIDWLLLPRSKIKQIGDGASAGDPARAFRHDVDALRKFLRLAGIPIRIKTASARAFAPSLIPQRSTATSPTQRTLPAKLVSSCGHRRFPKPVAPRAKHSL